MNKQIDMSAFIGKDFDCQFMAPLSNYKWRLIEGRLSDLILNDPYTKNTLVKFRPRLNKPQVLDDGSWMPSGLVVKILLSNYKHANGEPYEMQVPSGELKELANNDNYRLIWASVIGVEPDYKEWGEAHGMEVIES